MSKQRTFLTAQWRWLAMLNYECDPALLEPLRPQGTVLDTWQGRCLVSVVGFRFLDTRVCGIPIAFHRDFDELNLRFYVRRELEQETRRGVVFVKEVVPGRAIAWVARAIYGENYVRLPMRHEIRMPPEGASEPGRVLYACRPGPQWVSVSATVAGSPSTPAPDEEAAFIAEHYWGYARRGDVGTTEYEVEHPPWRVWPATSAHLEGDVQALYGRDFAPFLGAAPVSAFVAEGSPITVRRGTRLPDDGGR